MTDSLPESMVMPSSYMHPSKIGKLFLKRLRASGAKIGRRGKSGGKRGKVISVGKGKR